MLLRVIAGPGDPRSHCGGRPSGPWGLLCSLLLRPLRCGSHRLATVIPVPLLRPPPAAPPAARARSRGPLLIPEVAHSSAATRPQMPPVCSLPAPHLAQWVDRRRQASPVLPLRWHRDPGPALLRRPGLVAPSDATFRSGPAGVLNVLAKLLLGFRSLASSREGSSGGHHLQISYLFGPGYRIDVGFWWAASGALRLIDRSGRHLGHAPLNPQA
ncbi:hypothetical protein NDU88_005289 [Pleurodeles waltl]|uniref:Uncharacterized protein n=1 Tax=Pleurodeles waltl TaxID=8319 RepID=A0AAV7V7H1_PLEWA|nr:hypothetical protein NDU88_005289 [Pleurodeles waltl]